MPTLAINKAVLIASARVTREALVVSFDDGRTVSLPLAWYPRLAEATARDRSNYELIGDGQGIHWPDLDEDLSAAGLLAGRPSMESPSSFQRWLTGFRRRRAGVRLGAIRRRRTRLTKRVL
jgi:Protein of unknown function (DUF2442)